MSFYEIFLSQGKKNFLLYFQQVGFSQLQVGFIPQLLHTLIWYLTRDILSSVQLYLKYELIKFDFPFQEVFWVDLFCRNFKAEIFCFFCRINNAIKVGKLCVELNLMTSILKESTNLEKLIVLPVKRHFEPINFNTIEFEPDFFDDYLFFHLLLIYSKLYVSLF